MIETTEQIQTPAVSEVPATEIAIEPAAATETPESQTPEPEPPSHDEAALTAEITELWRLHADHKGMIKNQTENLRSLRAELGKRLSEMKQVLARPGRNGQWSSWLKQHKIARATADRLVLKFERSRNPDGNCLIESISEPTEEEIQGLFDKVAPKLRRVLRTPASVYRFIDLMTSSFASDRKATEEGLVIVKPLQKTELVGLVQEVQHEPVESPVEPVPLIAKVVREGNVQSTANSMAL
jgi:hypothetical protein